MKKRQRMNGGEVMKKKKRRRKRNGAVGETGAKNVGRRRNGENLEV